MAKKVALVTGAMGGLGTAICKALSESGFTVAANCLPNFPPRDEWLAKMKAEGFDFIVAEADVTDYDACAAMVKKLEAEVGPGRRSGQQCGHHARLRVQEDGQGAVGCRVVHQSRLRVQRHPSGARRHGRSRLGPGHQHVVGEWHQGTVRPGQLLGGQGRHPRLHPRDCRRSGEEGRYRECHRPRLYRYRHGHGDQAGSARLASLPPFRSVAWASPRKSAPCVPTWCRISPAT